MEGDETKMHEIVFGNEQGITEVKSTGKLLNNNGVKPHPNFLRTLSGNPVSQLCMKKMPKLKSFLSRYNNSSMLNQSGSHGII
ncbi:MAG: hypothetical protein GF313_13780 [Caldithrix sp.]|nr:hypothetical protein [Caldithrix sp.]